MSAMPPIFSRLVEKRFQACLVAAAVITVWCLVVTVWRSSQRSALAEIIASRQAGSASQPASQASASKASSASSPAGIKTSASGAGPGGLIVAGNVPPNVTPGQPRQPAGPSPMVERIIKRNIFSPREQPPQFQTKLTGVLGDEAMFENNQTIKVGGVINGAKLTKINGDSVELEFQGQIITVQIAFGPGGPGGPPGRGGPPSMGGGPVVVRSGGPILPPSPKEMTVTPEMIEQFKKLPPEQRQKALEQMPPEMRDKLR